MIKKLLCIIITLAALQISALAISSDPSEKVVGARPLGMGMAFMGISGDGSDLFLNPAGLGDISSLKWMSMSSKMLNDIDYLAVGVANSFSFGNAGIAYASQGVSGIPLTTVAGGTVEATGLSTNYLNSVIVLTYANDFPFAIPLLKDSKMGMNLKYYSQGFSNATGSLEGASGSGLDMDLAFQFTPSSYLSWGINMQNILPLDFTWVKNSTKEEIPLNVKVGAAFKALGEDGWMEFPNNLDILLDTDLTSAKAQVWHLGCEFWPTNFVALSGGVDQIAGAGGIANNLTGGLGIKASGFTFDYAYHKYGDAEGNATSYFSIGYVGPDVPKAKKKATPAKLPAIEYIEAPVVEKTISPLTTEDQLMAAKIRAYRATLVKKLSQTQDKIRAKKLKAMIQAQDKRLKELSGQ